MEKKKKKLFIRQLLSSGLSHEHVDFIITIWHYIICFEHWNHYNEVLWIIGILKHKHGITFKEILNIMGFCLVVTIRPIFWEERINIRRLGRCCNIWIFRDYIVSSTCTRQRRINKCFFIQRFQNKRWYNMSFYILALYKIKTDKKMNEYIQSGRPDYRAKN